MASKQLGKLRQWAGEVISKSEKTQVSGEFVQLEQDIEMRKKGMDQLHTAAEDYHAHISRKINSEALRSDEKVMHTEALGLVMINHGEELANSASSGESVFGAALTTYGRARCRVAAQQEIFAVTYADTFLTHIQRAIAELDEYSAARKKLESRRLTLDAAISKADRAPTFKKEKDKKEAEEELELANERYDEMAEDVKTRMDAIREGDLDSLRALGGFLDMETRFVEQYLETLKEVKAEWPEVDYSSLSKPSAGISSPHIFARPSARSSTSLESPKGTPPSLPSRFGSHRSMRSVRSTVLSKGSPKTSHQSLPPPDSESEEDEAMATPKRSRSKSTSKPGRSRSNSVAAAEVDNNDDDEPEDDMDADGKHKRKKSTASGVASWVGGALTGVMSRGKREKDTRPDKESFAALDDDDDDDGNGVPPRPRSALSNRSMKSNKSSKSRPRSRNGSISGMRNGKDDSKGKKVMKALFDFAGSSDELSFKTGDEIIVLQEVLDGWWLGEVGGKKGLFPTNYAVVISGKEKEGGRGSPSKASPARLPSRSRNPSTSSISKLAQITRVGQRNRDSGFMDGEDESRHTLFGGSRPGAEDSGYGADSASEISHEHGQDDESIDEGGWHPFGDHHRSPVQERNGGSFFDARLHGAEHSPSDSDSDSLSPAPEQPRRAPPISIPNPRFTTAPPTVDLSSSASSAEPVKRMPPPPPPRRKSVSSGAPAPPPLPARNPSSTLSAPLLPSRTHSSSALFSGPGSASAQSQAGLAPIALPGLGGGAEIRRAYSENNSPFESTSELSFDTVAMTGKEVRCGVCGCSEFIDDPFRGHNMCAKCSHTHA